MNEQQQEALWLEDRLTCSTASTAATVCGKSKFGSRYALWLEKTGQAKMPEPEGYGSVCMEMGKLFEPKIAEHFEKRYKTKLVDPGRYNLVKHSDFPHIGATVDRFEDTKDGSIHVVELKFVGRSRYWQKEAPIDYVYQVQQQMLVHGAHQGTIYACIHDSDDREANFLKFSYEPDRAIQTEIIECSRDFWGAVEARVFPKEWMDDKDLTKEALNIMYDEPVPGKILTLGESTEADVLRLKELKALLKDEKKRLEPVESEIQKLTTMIQLSMGDAEEGVTPGGLRVKWRKEGQDREVKYMKKARRVFRGPFLPKKK